MRDYRKFCRPKVQKNPKIGDVRVRLNCGEILTVSAYDYKKVGKNFKLDSFIGESPNTAGNLLVTNKILNQDMVLSPLDYVDNSDRFEIKEIIGSRFDDPYNGHQYVEIGGLKWATVNIGASLPSDYGLYFQWGDTQGYTALQVGSGEGQKYFDWADYKYGNGTSSSNAVVMTKYNSTDDLTTLEVADDAARANWGGEWRMPTTAEFQALGAAVNTAWTQVNNVYGILCTDKTDSSKTLFFPAAGYCYNGSVKSVGYGGSYWSSSLYTDSRQYAFSLGFYSLDAYWGISDNRYYGYAVRPVNSSAVVPEGTILAQDGDIITHNNTLNQDAIFSFNDWKNNVSDDWNLTGLYGITTYEEEDASDGDYVIMANGHTLIISSSDYDKVSSNWDHVDTIQIEPEQPDNP